MQDDRHAEGGAEQGGQRAQRQEVRQERDQEVTQWKGQGQGRRAEGQREVGAHAECLKRLPVNFSCNEERMRFDDVIKVCGGNDL